MFVLQNAALNLWKNKGRNLLLFAIIFAIIVSTTVAVGIFRTSSHMVEEYGNLFASRVSIVPARRMVGSGGNQTAELDPELAFAFAESDYLRTASLEVAGRSFDITSEAQQMEALEAVQTMQDLGHESVEVNAVYYLHAPDLLEAFEADVRSMGLSDDFNVRADTATYNQLIAPIERLGSVAFTFLIVVLALGAIILSLLALISVRERKYEIGVLRAIGMKKGQVASGLLFELVLITILAFSFAIFAGNAIAQPVSQLILESEEALSFSVNMNLRTALEIFGIAIALSVAAGFVAVTRITKYEPFKILTERA